MAEDKTRIEIREYTPGRETETAEEIDKEICDKIELLDARVDRRVREKYNIDIDDIDAEEECQLRREIIDYIRDCRDDENTMTMGRALRRYLCRTFAKKNSDGSYTFEIDDKNKKTVYKNIYIHVTESLCCTPETNTLLINYNTI